MSIAILMLSLVVSSALWCHVWLAERRETKFWRRMSEQWKGAADRGWAAWNDARNREEFWMGQALRSPLHGKPKDVPSA